MNDPRKHAEISEQIALLAAGALDPAQEGRALGHIRSCPMCAAELETWQTLSGALRRLPTTQPSPDLFFRTRSVAAAALAERAESHGHQRSLLLLVCFSWVFTLLPLFLARMAGIGLTSVFHWHFGWFTYVTLAISWLLGAAVAVSLLFDEPSEGRLA